MLKENIITKLAKEYGTPLYLYDKERIDSNIETIKNISSSPNLQINYATKANSNINLLKIIKQHGLNVDSTGYGEYYINRKAGFTNDQIYVVCNNLTIDEFKLLTNENIIISVDSIDQLKTLNSISPGYQHVMLRINPSFGDGENDSIITGGDNHKFGIDSVNIIPCINYIKEHKMHLVGINQHIGSLNLDYTSITRSVAELLKFIEDNNIVCDIINFGGGFGIDYNHHTNKQLDFASLQTELDFLFANFLANYQNPHVSLEFEPGRFIVANSAILVGTVTSIKRRGNQIYIGTDLEFSQMVRPTMYDSYHHITFITKNLLARNCNVVGNMCESGDYLCKDRKLIIPDIGELVIIHDVGAYGYSMASNFNNRLRPIELLVDDDCITIIRKRERIEDLLKNY